MLRHILLIGFFSMAQASIKGQMVHVEANGLVQKIQSELAGPPLADAKINPGVPHGEFLSTEVDDSKIYPGTQNNIQVYIPAQYDPSKPACLLVRLDGIGPDQGTVLDNLIAKNEVPVLIGVGISPGLVFSDSDGTPNRHPVRFNRSYEFDSVNERFADFVLNEVLPAVEKLKTKNGRSLNISTDGNDHAATGFSTGGIGAFTLAWQRPDQFRRVFATIGTFVSMRGGNDYPALIRKTEPKAIRIFLEDGSNDAWNPLFGFWYDANINMESALSFAGYDVAHAWGTHGHDIRIGDIILPDVMRWLWRDYPAPVKAGTSLNSTLQEITLPGEGWQRIPQAFHSATGLAANEKGEIFVNDLDSKMLYRVKSDDTTQVYVKHSPDIVSLAFGPDGKLYGAVPSQKLIVALDPQGLIQTRAEGIVGHSILVTNDNQIYVSEPGEHDDMPSRIWQIKVDGEKKIVDEGLCAASGIVFATDRSLFFAAEKNSQWVDSYVVRPDGSLVSRQPYYWLHVTDSPNNSGTEDLAIDTHGNLYAATRMGIQVADQNGRVRAILPLPTPCGPARSLCFGGEHFDELYVSDGSQLFKRKLKVPGFAPWANPKPFPSQEAD